MSINIIKGAGASSAVAVTSLPPFPVGIAVTISGLSIVAVTVSNLASEPLTVSGTTIAITDIEDGAGTSVMDAVNNAIQVNVVAGGAGNGSILDGSDTALKASVYSGSNYNPLVVRLSDASGEFLASATVTNEGTFAVQVTSLPAFAADAAVKVTSLPALTAASATVTNAGTFAVQVTSLPAFAVDNGVKVESLPALTAAAATVTNEGTFAVQVTSLPNFAVGTSILATVSNASTPAATFGNFPVQIHAVPSYFHVTGSYTAGQTAAVLKNIVSSTAAIYITDVVVSNGPTSGTCYLMESRSNAVSRFLVNRLHLAGNGGAVMSFRTPLVLDTNSALTFTSGTFTTHSVTVAGYVL